MEVAIATTLPGTTHHWCKWHVFRKAKVELGGIYSKKNGFKLAFNNVVNEMLTVDEFEKAWGELIEAYGLTENAFMIRAFEVRQKWAKPYFKDKYCGRMTSTQRVESANHMLKVYVPAHSSMNKFVSQYNKLLKDRNEAEDTAEHANKQVNFQGRVSEHGSLAPGMLETSLLFGGGRLSSRSVDNWIYAGSGHPEV